MFDDGIIQFHRSVDAISKSLWSSNKNLMGDEIVCDSSGTSFDRLDIERFFEWTYRLAWIEFARSI